MHDGACKRHNGEYKMRSGRCDVDREIEQADQRGHMDDAAADAQQAADETHQETDADAVPDIELVMVLFPVSFPDVALYAFSRAVPAGIAALFEFQDQEYSDHDQQHAQNDIKSMAGNMQKWPLLEYRAR